MIRRRGLPCRAAVISAVLLLSVHGLAQQRTADKPFLVLAGVRLLAGGCDVASSTQALRYPGARDVSPFVGRHPGLLRLSLTKSGFVALQTFAAYKWKQHWDDPRWTWLLAAPTAVDGTLAAHNWRLHPAPGGSIGRR